MSSKKVFWGHKWAGSIGESLKTAEAPASLVKPEKHEKNLSELRKAWVSWPNLC